MTLPVGLWRQTGRALKDWWDPVAMGELWGCEKTVLWPLMDAQELPGREQGLEQMGEKSPSP